MGRQIVRAEIGLGFGNGERDPLAIPQPNEAPSRATISAGLSKKAAAKIGDLLVCNIITGGQHSGAFLPFRR
jgi:hypothetical protein